MSQENVEILRWAYDELARGVYTPFRELLDPEVVYANHADALEAVGLSE